MDPILNCILAVCCPPLSAGQHEALSKFLTERGIENSNDVAAVILKHFDLAPQGSLQPFKDAIAALARGEHYTG